VLTKKIRGRSHGQLTQGPNFPSPGTKYKRSKNVFAVTFIALTLVPHGTKLLKILAQFLILDVDGFLIFGWQLTETTLKREIRIDLTLHFHISCVGRDDFAKLNRNASAANLIQIRPATFLP